MPRSTVFTFHFDFVPEHVPPAAARGMGVDGKPEGMNGKLAPALWAEGKREEVLRYVVQDVRTTLAVATACESCGVFRWIARSGRLRTMPLGQGWLAVEEARSFAAAGYLLDGRAVAEGEVYGVDGVRAWGERISGLTDGMPRSSRVAWGKLLPGAYPGGAQRGRRYERRGRQCRPRSSARSVQDHARKVER